MSDWYTLFFFVNIIYFSGEAEAILAKAKATAEGLALVSRALTDNGGVEVGCSVFLIAFFSCQSFWLFCLLDCILACKTIYLIQDFFMEGVGYQIFAGIFFF